MTLQEKVRRFGSKTLEKIGEIDTKKVRRVAIGGAFFSALGLAAYFGIIKPIAKEMEFTRVYSQKLSQYADSNGDGHISPFEKYKFDQKFFEKNKLIVLGWPEYEDGTSVSTERITGMLRDYSE
jgi:hypothetical protein